jgi:FtsP/CotA-like multicopper oxidase with cupredoxin domain/plastocyanin
MATIELWIQIENNPWDVAPHNIDRMTGQTMQQVTGNAPIIKSLVSPVSGVVQSRTMFRPLSQDALILRRYTANWAAPADRKVNPWDLNEPDPTDSGTMGTIPGSVIECDVGDTVLVHFRNTDNRLGKALQARTHSLHPHGFVFAPTSDGAYPLSPPDSSQPVGGEAAAWTLVGVSQFKKGDRVPPGGTFTYTWNTFGWPTTAGVWLYHDHSICDMENVQLGAIGIIVIRNPADPEEFGDQDLPGGTFNGLPTEVRCFPFPFLVPALPHNLDSLGLHGNIPHSHGGPTAPAPAAPASPATGATAPNVPPQAGSGTEASPPDRELIAKHGDLLIELNKDLVQVSRLCLSFYRQPPAKARYLQLFHNLGDATMCINGRKYLGNTPTLIGGLQTRMRFGLVAMGNVDGFHTFHLHGHRWIIPGPDGNTVAAIQGSAQVTAVSQFEDTRTFGPANSFAFGINQGSFMGSIFTPDPTKAPGTGEWHMHCHVLSHMMDGMMGSLLLIKGGELALRLPVGEPCPADTGGGDVLTVTVKDFEFFPKALMVSPGQTVTWQWAGAQHSTTSDTGVWDSGVHNAPHTFTHTFTAADVGKTFPYFCSIHGGPGGAGMSGSIMVM